MIAFIIPLISKKNATNWGVVSKLCNRSINSVLNQSEKNFMIYLVCNESPNEFKSSEYVCVIAKDYPIPPLGNHRQSMYDKLCKARDGLVAASNAGCSHYMLLDADDCISRNLINYTRTYSEFDGWYLDSGWIRYAESCFVHIQKKNFHRLCGSSVIAPIDLNTLPDLNGDIQQLRPFLEHHRIVDTWINEGKKMQRLTRPSAIYVLGTGENISSLNRVESIKSFIKSIITTRIMDKNTADEFSLDQS